jgi:alpha-mannosidase
VCGHKWADLSESGFGVAVLNDCKYGYATHANVIRLSLLRSPTSPGTSPIATRSAPNSPARPAHRILCTDPTADIGEQAFTYALLPHADSFQTGGVIEEAFKLNVRPPPPPSSPAPLF